MPLNSDIMRLKRKKYGLSFDIDWGSIRSFPNKNPLIEYLTTSGSEIDQLCELYLSIPPSAKQLEYVKKMLKRINELIPIKKKNEKNRFISNDETNMFIAIEPLLNPVFKSSGKHLKRVWLCLSLIGVNSQREGGYTLRDLREIAIVEVKNRTLIRNVAKEMEKLGIIKKTKSLNRQPRYIYTGGESEDLFSLREETDLDSDRNVNGSDEFQLSLQSLYRFKDNVTSLSKFLGKKHDLANTWEKYESGPIVFGSVNDLCDYVMESGFTKEIGEFFDLLPEWIGLLFELTSSDPGKDLVNLLVELFENSNMKKKIENSRQRSQIEDDDKAVATHEGTNFMLIDLSDLMDRIKNWNLINDPSFRNVYLNSTSTSLLQRHKRKENSLLK